MVKAELSGAGSSTCERRTPLHVGVDHRQRLVEENCIYVRPHEAAPKRDLLLQVGGKAACLLLRASQSTFSQHAENFLNALVNLILPRNAPVAQRKCEVVVDGHRVTRRLGNWNTWAMLRSSVEQLGDVFSVEGGCALRRGRTSPEMMFSSVVLPQPEGPRSAYAPTSSHVWVNGLSAYEGCALGAVVAVGKLLEVDSRHVRSSAARQSGRPRGRPLAVNANSLSPSRPTCTRSLRRQWP